MALPPGAKPLEEGEPDCRYGIERGPAAGGPETSYALALDGEPLVRDGTLEAIRAVLESDMHFRVALSARGWLFVHAAVVAWRERAILIPGRTHTGKSSLALALVRAGAEYWSDEYAVFDPEGWVHPYPRPLSERRRDGSARLIPMAELGGPRTSEPLSLGLVVSTRYEPEGAWRPEEMSRGDCVMALFDNTVVARLDPERALRTLTRGVAGAIGLRGPRGEAATTAPRILDDAERAFAG